MQAESLCTNSKVTRVQWARLHRSGMIIVLHSACSGCTGHNTDDRHPFSSAALQPRFTFTHGLALGRLILTHTGAHLYPCVQARRRVLAATLVGFGYIEINDKEESSCRDLAKKKKKGLSTSLSPWPSVPSQDSHMWQPVQPVVLERAGHSHSLSSVTL